MNRKILLMSIGTRGDIEPFVAVGELLRAAGHDVAFAFPEQYLGLVPEGFRSYPFDRRFVELVESEEGRALMGGKQNFIWKARAALKLAKIGMAVNKVLVREQFRVLEHEDPDIVVHHAKCSYPLLWSIKKSRRAVVLSPIPYLVYATDECSHTGFQGDKGKFLNRISYRFFNFVMIKTIKDSQKELPVKYKLGTNVIREAYFNEPFVYCISPSLFRGPDDWPNHVKVVGFYDIERRQTWEPSEELQNFLRASDKVLFVSFGSMISSDPVSVSQVVLGALKELGIPTVVNVAAGGLVRLEEYNDDPNFCFVDSVPYDWLLPQVYAVVHHGGSGTTHWGLKSGCPTMIIPHVFDQYDWNELMYRLGVGPKGVGVSKVTQENLKPLLLDLMNQPSYRAKAAELSKKISEEDFEDDLFRSILGQGKK